MSKSKTLGQVYTKPFIVAKILDDCGYKGPSILGKSILDPACGDGQFLIEVVKRIKAESHVNNLHSNLSFVNGFDIDQSAINECIKNLNNTVGFEYNWNVFNIDTLRQSPKECSYDFIIGNPPYIRIHNLKQDDRDYIKSKYSFCSNGTTDVFYAFIEHAFNHLPSDGYCGFITPNSYLTSNTASYLRQYIYDNKLLLKLTNYGSIQLFDNVSTYTCISIFHKNKSNCFQYEKAFKKEHEISFENNVFDYNVLSNKLWGFNSNSISYKGIALKDIVKISVGLATLADRVYISNNLDVESDLIKDIIKVSKSNKSDGFCYQKIIFPYKLVNGKYKVLSEEELKKYPLTYQYFLSNKNILSNRSLDKRTLWYEYGRTQAIDSGFGKKILFSPMLNTKIGTPDFLLTDDADCTFYSGYSIKTKSSSVNLDSLLKILNSQRMFDFILSNGKDLQGGWKSFSKSIIGEFVLTKEEFDII